jgi:hypothetical protein
MEGGGVKPKPDARCRMPDAEQGFVTFRLCGQMKLRRGIMSLLNVGDNAPEFKVRDHTGKDVDLSDYRGKRVILWFYPKADTPG